MDYATGSSYVSAISAAAAAAAGLVQHFNSGGPSSSTSCHFSTTAGLDQQLEQQTAIHPHLFHLHHSQSNSYPSSDPADAVAVPVSTPSTNALATAAVSLFGGGFHANGFASSLASPTSVTSSRLSTSTTSSTGHYAGSAGGGSSFFPPPPNAIHFQGSYSFIHYSFLCYSADLMI